MHCFDRFVTRARIRTYSCMFALITLVSMGALFATSNGLLDTMNRPIGTDFAGIWSAGVIGREQGYTASYDYPRHNALQREIFGKDTLPLGWHYPPVFMLVIEPLSMLPYLTALVLYQVVGFALYFLTLRGILRTLPFSDVLWPIAGFTAIWVNLMHAHNGFLTAALFGTGLMLLPTRPIIAGLVMGALCYKPQFGLLIPIALMASGHWRAFAAATVSVLALCAITYLRYGIETWEAFLAYSTFTQQEVIEGGTTGWYKMQTVFASARMWGASVSIAYAAHIAASVAVAVCVFRFWRGSAAYPLKAALLMVGALLVSPYAFDYDLMLLAPALAFLTMHGMQHGFVRHEHTLLCVAWLMPFLARSIGLYLMVPAGVLVLAFLFVFILRRGRASDTLSTSPLHA